EGAGHADGQPGAGRQRQAGDVEEREATLQPTVGEHHGAFGGGAEVVSTGQERLPAVGIERRVHVRLEGAAHLGRVPVGDQRAAPVVVADERERGVEEAVVGAGHGEGDAVQRGADRLAAASLPHGERDCSTAQRGAGVDAQVLGDGIERERGDQVGEVHVLDGADAGGSTAKVDVVPTHDGEVDVDEPVDVEGQVVLQE